jgi:hypothetical protein
MFDCPKSSAISFQLLVKNEESDVHFLFVMTIELDAFHGIIFLSILKFYLLLRGLCTCELQIWYIAR